MHIHLAACSFDSSTTVTPPGYTVRSELDGSGLYPSLPDPLINWGHRLDIVYGFGDTKRLTRVDAVSGFGTKYELSFWNRKWPLIYTGDPSEEKGTYDVYPVPFCNFILTELRIGL